MAVSLTIAAVLGFALLAFLLGRAVGSAAGKTAGERELRTIRDQLGEAQKRLAVSESRNVAYGEAEKILKDTFNALAGSALTSNSEQFLQRAEERFKHLQLDTAAELEKRKAAIENLIAPLDQSLKSLDSKVSDLEAKRIEAYTEVRTQISELGSVNKELRNQTGSLVQALRSPNVRGDWGQMQLRRTVEMSGMLGHCDFFEQVSEASENGRLTPDMIVRLPGDRRVVVDAKAPRMYLDGLADRTEGEKSQYLRDHAAKVRAHMTQLAGKRYWEQFAPTPEFVIMFLPVEALFAAALQEDPGLLEFGADKKVIPASPLTLIALLRAVNYGWKQESLAHDAAKIRELGKDLYSAVRVLAGHLVKMRDNLEDTVQAFNSSIGSVERSFLSKARKLVELNVAADESIPRVDPIDERLRGLEAIELRAELGDTPMLEGLVLEPSGDREG
jgi:DNA recombination protein RmuC